MNILPFKARIKKNKEDVEKGSITESKTMIGTLTQKKELKGKISQYKNFISKGAIANLSNEVMNARIKNSSFPTLKKTYFTIVSNIDKKNIVVKEEKEWIF